MVPYLWEREIYDYLLILTDLKYRAPGRDAGIHSMIVGRVDLS